MTSLSREARQVGVAKTCLGTPSVLPSVQPVTEGGMVIGRQMLLLLPTTGLHLPSAAAGLAWLVCHLVPNKFGSVCTAKDSFSRLR